jgi:3-hydroxyacyl-[acyl-carrier-protein] dehydratase
VTAAWLGARGLAPRALDRAALAALLPQRPPFMLVDRVVAAAAPGRERPALAAELDISGAEEVLAAHFPGRPIWPGSYTLEGLAQACALAGALHRGHRGAGGAPLVLVAAVKVKLIAPITPPARLEYFVEETADLGNLRRFAVAAFVGGREVATGSLDVAMGEAAP